MKQTCYIKDKNTIDVFWKWLNTFTFCWNTGVFNNKKMIKRSALNEKYDDLWGRTSDLGEIKEIKM